MRTNSALSEGIGMASTATRYLLAERMARRVRDGEPITLDMLAFVSADILDGAILRKFDMDTPIRRIADGVVDHVSVARVAYEVAKKNSDSRPYIAVLAARALLVAGLNIAHLFKTGEVTKGNKHQRSTNLASAAFALIANTGNERATNIAGTLSSLIAVSTAPKHFQDLGKVHAGDIRTL